MIRSDVTTRAAALLLIAEAVVAGAIATFGDQADDTLPPRAVSPWASLPLVVFALLAILAAVALWRGKRAGAILGAACLSVVVALSVIALAQGERPAILVAIANLLALAAVVVRRSLWRLGQQYSSNGQAG
jgi:cytochrome bd-type quinol oxidase subunit 2